MGGMRGAWPLPGLSVLRRTLAARPQATPERDVIIPTEYLADGRKHLVEAPFTSNAT